MLKRVRFINFALGLALVVDGALGTQAKDLHWKYNGPSIPWWVSYVELAIGTLFLYMELSAARKRR